MSILGNFKVVSDNEKGYVEKLEQKYSISLPPIFKAFCKAVYLNSLKADEGYRLYHPDEELGFDGFEFTLNELLSYYLEVGEPHTKFKMIPIATSDIHAGGICLCYDGINSDKIFVNDEMSNDQFVEVATDILDFISQLKQFKIT